MELNTILIILGIIALIGLVGHGIWSNRREKSLYFDNANAFGRETQRTTLKPSETAVPDFAQKPQGQALQQESQPAQPTLEQHIVNATDAYAYENTAQSVNDIRISIPTMSDAATQQYAMSPQSPAQPVTQQVEKVPVNAPIHYEYKSDVKSSAANFAEGNLAERNLDDLARFDNTEEGIHQATPELQVSLQETVTFNSPISQAKPIEPVVAPTAETYVTEKPAEDYIMLYVVAAENRLFQGVQLHQALEREGFILGHDALYHRHLDLTVASPVIFSVANVDQPGSFPIHHMHDFSTIGVVIYMPLPSAGNNRVNLKTMLKSAKNLAAQLGGFVLTDEEQELDENAEQDYLARV